MTETLFARGEWGVQTGRMHVSRRRPDVVCYRVVHLPSDCYVLGLISARRDAETIVRWLHDEVPMLTVSAGTPPVTSPPEAVAKVQAIIDVARNKMCVGARVARVALAP